QDSYPELRDVVIEEIEEQEQKELADSLDYWYVPTYFVDGVKLLEGVPTKEKVENVLRAAL
ncbi:thioredoxin, partial [Erysipelatoclostridium ramosum]